ncbi:hypothetical protein J2741_000683 [Methanolinea mesophila]|uniref:DUF169 domain-containing protein n=1 Tax=Methanolinea mesophila TaxID=547055 RepID=UPI001AE6279C|nr:DUF169 domain-containing protein [Methanolinea mesophila]MBP1928136.1 hypothetical protein [Methanolinea mesophila]
MAELTFREIGDRLVSAFGFTARPLAVYGSDTKPAGAVHLPAVNRCIAMSMFRMATEHGVDAVYMSGDEPEGCCMGGLTHMGFIATPEDIKYFVSTGRADIRGGAAEFLKADPGLVERSFAAEGTITPPGRYLIIRSCDTLDGKDPGVRSICCFGNAEEIRNLAALVHFDRDDPFTAVVVPWGPSCSTYISYPAGMASKAPQDTAFMGPQDPTQNYAFPPDMMALGIPAGMARRMVRNLDTSFVIRRPKVAFPDHEKIAERKKR